MLSRQSLVEVPAVAGGEPRPCPPSMTGVPVEGKPSDERKVTLGPAVLEW